MTAHEIEKYTKQLRKKSYLARRFKWRTACKKLAEDASVAAVPGLIKALNLDDSKTQRMAKQALLSTTSRDVVNKIYQHIMIKPDKKLVDIAAELKLNPARIGQRCLVLILAGKLDAYYSLDIDYKDLQSEYKKSSPLLRKKVMAAIRKSGDVELASIFRQKKLATDLSQYEAISALEIYKENQLWSDIFNLLPLLSLRVVPHALDILKSSNWQPDESKKADQELLAELLEMRQNLKTVLKQGDQQEIVLGPTVQKWLDQGKEQNWRQRSAKELRQIIKSGVPNEAVTALSALSAQGELNEKDIKAAQQHRHWLVRLALLNLYDSHEAFLSPKVPLSVQGAHIHIEQLALYISLYNYRACNANPDHLNQLQTRISKTKDKKFKAWAQLLASMIRYQVGRDIFLDTNVSVEFDAPGGYDIEIG